MTKIKYFIGLNMFFIPIKLMNFDLSPYKIKSHVFISKKKFVLLLISN
jgi:hypothetical protein